MINDQSYYIKPSNMSCASLHTRRLFITTITLIPPTLYFPMIWKINIIIQMHLRRDPLSQSTFSVFQAGLTHRSCSNKPRPFELALTDPVSVCIQALVTP